MHETNRARNTTKTQQKTRFDYGFKDASLCPRKPQFQRPQNTVPARIHNPPAHKKFTTFSKLAASTLVARANPRRTGSHSHTPPTRPRTASARSCDRPSERLDREGSQHTAAPENAAAAPQNCEGQRHDCHEGRIQWGSRTQCESGRRRDGVNLRRRLREPDAQRRRCHAVLAAVRDRVRHRGREIDGAYGSGKLHDRAGQEPRRAELGRGDMCSVNLHGSSDAGGGRLHPRPEQKDNPVLLGLLRLHTDCQLSFHL